MENANINTALTDLVDAIRDLLLGPIETSVIIAAGENLIQNWNEHNLNDPIDEAVELEAWETKVRADFPKSN